MIYIVNNNLCITLIFVTFLMQKSEYSTRLSTMLKTLVYSSNCRVVLSLVTESVTLAPSTIGKLLKV